MPAVPMRCKQRLRRNHRRPRRSWDGWIVHKLVVIVFTCVNVCVVRACVLWLLQRESECLHLHRHLPFAPCTRHHTHHELHKQGLQVGHNSVPARATWWCVGTHTSPTRPALPLGRGSIHASRSVARTAGGRLAVLLLLRLRCRTTLFRWRRKQQHTPGCSLLCERWRTVVGGRVGRPASPSHPTCRRTPIALSAAFCSALGAAALR